MSRLRSFGAAGAAIGLLLSAAVAQSATVFATAGTISAVWLAAKPGDTIQLSGTFASRKLAYKSGTAITLDAIKAVFSDTLVLDHVDGLKIIGGNYGSTTGPTKYGRAVVIYGGRNIAFYKPVVVSDGEGQGIRLQRHGQPVSRPGQLLRAWHGDWDVARREREPDTKHLHQGRVRRHPDRRQPQRQRELQPVQRRCPRPPARTPTASRFGASSATRCSRTSPACTTPRPARRRASPSVTPEWGGGLRIQIEYNTVFTNYVEGIVCYGCVDSNISTTTSRRCRVRAT